MAWRRGADGPKFAERRGSFPRNKQHHGITERHILSFYFPFSQFSSPSAPSCFWISCVTMHESCRPVQLSGAAARDQPCKSVHSTRAYSVITELCQLAGRSKSPPQGTALNWHGAWALACGRGGPRASISFLGNADMGLPAQWNNVVNRHGGLAWEREKKGKEK